MEEKLGLRVEQIFMQSPIDAKILVQDTCVLRHEPWVCYTQIRSLHLQVTIVDLMMVISLFCCCMLGQVGCMP